MRQLLLILFLFTSHSPALADGDGEAPFTTDLMVMDAGVMKPSRLDPETETIVVYFGASWCPPCRAFIPTLKEVAARWRQQKRSVEVVFFSADGSCDAMEEYIRRERMPWHFVSCRGRERMPAIAGLRGQPLPGVVVLDRQGRVLDTSYQNHKKSDHESTLARADAFTAPP
ncbi:MAG: thioredoxin-like domain-containing protein [Pseudomonadota bacterium]